MLIKKMYLIFGITIILLLAFQCGEKENKFDAQNREITENENAENSANSFPEGNSEEGKQYFLQVCATCHGQDGKGLPKLGKDLTTSKFVSEKSDKELLNYVIEGRLPSDPLNTTGVAMPPKGGNPALTNKQIIDIISYVRKIHE